MKLYFLLTLYFSYEYPETEQESGHAVATDC